MSSIEEKLWDYIDGSATPDEQKAISLLIEQDELYRNKYLELLKLDQEFSAIELDEPSMAFTYNVVETIRAEHAKKPLKAAINPFIIKGIFGFFAIIILALMIFLIANFNWSAPSPSAQLTSFKLPDVKNFITGPAIKGFFYFDVILGLFLFDSYLRKRSFSK
jgi:hypothetical protein